jgi:hypothetical protein
MDVGASHAEQLSCAVPPSNLPAALSSFIGARAKRREQLEGNRT